MSGVCTGLQWLVYFWCGEDNCWICFSLFFPLFILLFSSVCLIAPAFLVGVQLCHVLVLSCPPKISSRWEKFASGKGHPMEFFPHIWNAGLSSRGIWERSRVRQRMGPSRLVGAAPLLALWSSPVELVFSRDRFLLGLG